jgi:APA family basic amino acid/polyamine antiporter
VSLGLYTIKLFLAWAVIGLVVYFTYSRQRSHLANGTEHAEHVTP